MKKTKRFFAVLLAALMLAGTLAAGAMAAPAMTDTGTVKITNALAGANYKFYRVMDIDGISTDGKNSFITNDNWNTAIRTFGMGYATFDGDGVGAAVTISTDFNTQAKAQEFAKKVVDAAAADSISADREESVTASGEFTVAGLQYGFYVMVSSRLAAGSTPIYSVFTVNSGTVLDITEKNEELPKISKKVNGSDGISADFNTVLNYEITITAAAGTDQYAVEDMLPNHIEFMAGTLKLTKGGAELVRDTDYTVTVEAGTGANDKVTVTLSDAVRNSLADGDKIVVSYQGKLAANSETIEPYTNTAKLTYGPTGDRKVMSDSAKVLSGHISFNKKDNSNNDLAGAKFLVKNEEGKFAKLTGSGVAYSFDSWVDNDGDATPIITTGSATAILIRGFKAGKYTLVETAAPDGYIKGKDTEVRIEAKVDSTTLAVTALSTDPVTVINTKGSELPGTGGVGAAAFYTAGGLLVACALVLFAVKRRRSV